MFRFPRILCTLVLLLSGAGRQLYAQLQLSQMVYVFGNIPSSYIGTGTIGNLGMGVTPSSQNWSLSSTPFSALPDGGPVVGTGVLYAPPYALFQNNSFAGSLSFSDIYPISGGRLMGDVNFYGGYKRLGSVEARWVYTMIAPNDIIPSMTPSSQTCATEMVYLSSPRNWPLFSDNLVQSSVVWEYSVDNGAVWKTLGSNSQEYATAYSYGFTGSQMPETQSGMINVRFRCRIKASYANKDYYSPYSAETNNYTFLPAGPRVDVTKLQKTSSCAGEQTGTIFIPGSAITSGYATIRWMLRPAGVTTPCDPDLAGGASACGDIIDWSNGNVPVSGGVTVNNVRKGSYTLWVINPSGTAGNCFTPIDVDIDDLPVLTAAQDVARSANPACYGATDGKITITASGGNAASGYFFTLKQNGTVVRAQQQSSGNSFTWTGLPAGNYTGEVKDGACAPVVPVNVQLTQPPQVKGQLTAQHPTCITPGNGSISVVADPGVTNYQYKLYKDAALLQQSAVTTSRTYTFGGLSNGDYSVEILNMDFPVCTGWSGTISLNAVPPLTLAQDARNMVTCFGGSDGSLKYSAGGGSGSYTFLLQRTGMPAVSNSTGIFNGLQAGTYTITVQNNVAGCNDAVSQPVTITEPPVLQVSLQTTNISCNGAQDGIVKSVVSGGSGFYIYKWEQLKNGVWTTNSFWFDTDTKIDALSTGTYRVTVADSRSANCSVQSGAVTITELPALQSGGVTITPAVCLADGATINISASGGDNIYTYFFTLNGTGYTAFTSGTKVYTAGSYRFRIRDGKGCTLDLPNAYDVSLPPAALGFTTQLSAYNGFQISCNGAADGKITVTAAGGNGGAYTGYQYKLNNGAYQPSNIFNGLTAGTYTISVKDARGCETSGSVTLVQPQMSVNATKQDVICFGQPTGSIITDIIGGAAPYRWQLNGTNVTGATATNLPAGNYALHVTDANGCTKDTTLTISHQYPALAFTAAAVTDIQCSGSTGSIAINAAGGDGSYQYRLSADNWATSQAYTSGAGLNAGVYALKVTDNHGCSLNYSSPLTITAPPASLSLFGVLSDYNGYNISCAGGDNGSVQLTATGGNGATYSGYTYAIDNGAFGPASLISGIKAGMHVFKVKDGRGCVATRNYSFTESAQALSIQLVGKQDVRCAAIPGGSITVAGSGGTGALLYSLNGTDWQPGPVFTGLTAGNYTVTVRDANSCGNTLPVQILSVNPAITIDNITRNDVICFGTPGAIQVQAHGGSGQLTNEYALNGGAYTAFTNTTPLGAGDYTVRVKDAIGCYSAVSNVVSITAPANPLAATVATSDFHGKQISCYGLSDGAFSLTTTGGNDGGYQGYLYSVNGGTYTGTTQYTGMPAGNYAVKIKDGRGCEITKNIVLQQPAAAVSLALSDITHLACGGIPTGSIALQTTGGTTPYAYTMNNGIPQASSIFSSLPVGNYTLSVKDINGCAATVVTTVKEMYPPVTATATVTPVRCYGEANGTIVLQPAGGDGNYNYQWNNAGVSGAQAQSLTAGSYTVNVTDGKGCGRSYSYEVTQPAALGLTVTGSQICDGVDDGTVAAMVQGGTQPYQYALNNGGWSAGNSFANLTAGEYALKVQDARGCGATGTTTIIKRNVKPDVNFLVASRKNAFDTLVIKEISLPAPDLVSWTFDPQAILLGYDRGTPLVRFTTAGTYWVAMKATFGECTYELRKDIQINAYDPLAGPSYSVPVSVIDTVMLSPNPNDGNFRFQIKLKRKQQVMVTVFDLNGRILAKLPYSPALQIDDRIALGSVNNGIFILRVVTENESRDVRFIVNR
ncbi:T9SS type A sorting domain-containing protein [Chitinophaga varians]|uniref:T9SS type A sorting domain-containing protein n=1 Tax=Chitinophaga varians TaxID=2202339 RepID=A0A847RNX5_9BACT|nr:T9SS type A sorting domain-containing protein [Chitinophaga varians]NLR67440.1 T9SS type A sorting domain-containing protein [Chitinophaga varians]